MDGVSAVRAYTLLAVLAIVAGGWMLNEAPEADLIEDEMDTFAELEAARNFAVVERHFGQCTSLTVLILNTL